MNVSGKLSSLIVSLALTLFLVVPAQAFVPGGSLDPTTIPKYVQPLVIPPPMPASADVNVPAANYNIAVRQFKQQILPGGIWNSVNGRTDAFAPTTVWSYGRAEDTIPGLPGAFVAPRPVSEGVSFNYPAFTVETTSNMPTTVRWINDLVADPVTCAASVDKTIAACNYLPHLFPIDQSLHWANPPNANCLTDAMNPSPNRTDCVTAVPTPYTGPVPVVVHVHGAHVQPHSDGYPNAWWLPGAPGTKGIPLSYVQHGTDYTQANNANTVAGSAYYAYENSQPATTLWYHDHAMGMTRLNVYAGPAGFWMVRGGANDTAAGVLPGPAPTAAGDPNFDGAYRSTIREIPLAIQDRSFNADGSLFYPQDRSFFDGFTGPYIGGTGTPAGPSDISGIWNPEAFFNTMVVNGTTWPKLDVTPARYRLRMLDGCNSRTLNLALKIVASDADGIPGNADDVLGAEVPFYQIGAEQGFLPKVVKITTGFATVLPGDGTFPATDTPAVDPAHALLLGPAERADVIVDFSGMAAGTRIRMINTADDGPFGGFAAPVADPLTTGQVMDFVVSASTPHASDLASTPVESLVLPAEAAIAAAVTTTRQVSLNEMMSSQVCVEVDPIVGIVGTLFSTTPGDPAFLTNCAAATVAVGNFAEPMGPQQALLGVLATDPLSGAVTAVTKMFVDPITENPLLGSTEIWEIYNTTVDAHPIHLHLVRYQVVNREALDPVALAAGTLVPSGVIQPPRPNEMGYKDTVVSYPGEITRIKATFDIAGLYVWHCHIVEHEDNEMMRPFYVHTLATVATLTPATPSPQVVGSTVLFSGSAVGVDNGPYEYRFWWRSGTSLNANPWTLAQNYSPVATWSWNTAALAAGTYQVRLDVRHVGALVNLESQKVVNYNLFAPVSATAATLVSNLTSPRPVGTPSVIFTGGAVGGDPRPYEYRFWFRSGTALTANPWTLVQNYSTTATWTWNTAALAAGSYQVRLDVRHVGATVNLEVQKVVTYKLIVPATAATLVSNLASPQAVGSVIAFTGGATGGDAGPYEYRFWYRSGTAITGNSWTLVQNYSTVATWSWNSTALAVGTYQVRLDVRHVGSTVNLEAQKIVNFNLLLAVPATSATLVPGVTSPQPVGTAILFTGGAVGGDVRPYEYRFWYRSGTAITGNPWTLVQNYSTTTTWTWNTAALAAGTYQVRLDVRHVGATVNLEVQKVVNYSLVP